MFGLQDIRKSKVWQEAYEEGVTGVRRAMVHNCIATGMSIKAIAKLMKITEKEVKRLAKEAAQ